MRNKISTYIIITTLVMALLVSTGKATSVYALANPVIPPEIAPVFDTQIIQLQDYIENNVTQPQFEVFNVLLGLYVLAQGGMSDYKLHDPYTTQDGILGWLKSCGIQLYNSLIGMGAIGTDPITGIDYRPFIKGAMDIAMGCAVKSTQYTDVNDFVSDVNVQDKYFIPLDFGVQGALNYIFSKNGGMYNWQFENSDFETTMTYDTTVLLPTDPYWGYIETLTAPRVRANFRGGIITNFLLSADIFETYRNVLFNTTDQKFYFYSDDGNVLATYSMLNGREAGVIYGGSFVEAIPRDSERIFNFSDTYVLQNTYPEIVQYFIDHPNYNRDYILFVNDFVQHYYYGPNWDNKTEIFHTTNLNLDPNSLPYYQQIGNNYLLDIKGILQNLLNTVDLDDVILNNLYDLTGVVVTDPVLTHVAVEILEEIQTINVPIPVNLNDVALYTENDYIEEIKNRGRKFGEVIGQYIIFWHNSDPATCYILLGGFVVILLSAFIGKWGHS